MYPISHRATIILLLVVLVLLQRFAANGKEVPDTTQGYARIVRYLTSHWVSNVLELQRKFEPLQARGNKALRRFVTTVLDADTNNIGARSIYTLITLFKEIDIRDIDERSKWLMKDLTLSYQVFIDAGQHLEFAEAVHWIIEEKPTSVSPRLRSLSKSLSSQSLPMVEESFEPNDESLAGDPSACEDHCCNGSVLIDPKKEENIGSSLQKQTVALSKRSFMLMSCVLVSVLYIHFKQFLWPLVSTEAESDDGKSSLINLPSDDQIAQIQDLEFNIRYRHAFCIILSVVVGVVFISILVALFVIRQRKRAAHLDILSCGDVTETRRT